MCGTYRTSNVIHSRDSNGKGVAILNWKRDETIASYAVPAIFVWPWLWIAIGIYGVPREYAWILISIGATPIAILCISPFVLLAAAPTHVEFAFGAALLSLVCAAYYSTFMMAPMVLGALICLRIAGLVYHHFFGD